MVYRAYFDIPNVLSGNYSSGSSIKLLNDLVRELQGAVEIKVSLFLYNNPHLHSFFEGISDQGTHITIYSLPLAGYSTQPVTVYYRNSERNISSSKHEYANKTYDRVKMKKNMNMKIFPHTYLWSKQKYSRGNDLYSLHNKSIMAIFPEDKVKCISSSCNFAFADPKHSENFIVVEDCPNTIAMFNTYFTLLDQNALPIDNYETYSKSNYDCQYIVQPINVQDSFVCCYFTAPFIKYNGIGSNNYVQQKIIELLHTAKNRIYVCAQHINDIDSYGTNKQSIVAKIVKMGSLNENLDIKVLKQTSASHQKQGSRTEKTEIEFGKVKNIQQRRWHPVVHDKFIVVDDTVLVTTANFTPTQFAWQENRMMEYLINNQSMPIRNTFSEVNSFHFIRDEEVTNNYNEHFNQLWSQATEV